MRWETADLTGQDRDKLAAILDDLSKRWKAAQDRCKQYQKLMDGKHIDTKVRTAPPPPYTHRAHGHTVPDQDTPRRAVSPVRSGCVPKRMTTMYPYP